MALKLIEKTVTVAAAGTAVQISSTQILALGAICLADPGNTGKVYVGDSTVDNTKGIELDPNQDVQIETPDVREYIDLSTIYVDADTNDNVLRVLYWERS